MPKTGRAGPGNLPVALSSFVGRGPELREVKRLLGVCRLVTLTGVGGTGKTRLALRLAAEARRAFAGGMWFVDLTRLHATELLTVETQDPNVLAYLVMGVLGVRQNGRGSSVEQLTGYLTGRPGLLVLDNCEHLIPASTVLVDRLLRACPGLTVLATSREPLSVTGETAFAVPPLPTPARTPGVEPAGLTRWAAVELFVTRAQAAEPGFSLTESNQEAVAELCRRLDGLPLAIELAAARIRTLDPAQILDRLSDRFALLTRGSRTAPARQQTLRACVAWSFALCAKPERVLWARLSVFGGGFELDAVEGICTDEVVPAADLLDAVSGLVDKSILARDDANGGQSRYRMLETLRDYGHERLVAAGRRATVQRRHRDWYEQLAGRACAEWVSDRQAYWAARLDREYPNLWAAVGYCLREPGEAEGALRLLVAAPPQWRSARGLFGVERRWLDHALGQVTAPSAVRARALLLTAYLAARSGDIDTAARRLTDGEQEARQLSDPTALAFAAFLRGGMALLRNDVPAAVEALEHGLALAPSVPQPEFAPAVRLQLLTSLGVAVGLTGDRDRARGCYQEVLDITEPRGEGVNQLAARWGLGLTAWLDGELEEAATQLRQGLRLARSAGWGERHAANTVEVLAWIAARQVRHRLAALLLGAADTLRTEHDKPITATAWMLADHDTCERHTRGALGDPAFDDAFRHGRALSGAEILALALDEQPSLTPAPREAPEAARLTRREHEIADLIAGGLANKDIAARLVISPRTVESHVEHILAKLGFTTRTRVAAWVVERQSADTTRSRDERTGERT